jgi:hypothetical protein
MGGNGGSPDDSYLANVRLTSQVQTRFCWFLVSMRIICLTDCN